MAIFQLLASVVKGNMKRPAHRESKIKEKRRKNSNQTQFYMRTMRVKQLFVHCFDAILTPMTWKLLEVSQLTRVNSRSIIELVI